MDDTAFVHYDREVRFDVNREHLKCVPGEEEIDYLPEIEDTKGNNGEKGALRVTNLRLIWTALADPDVNLSIGHACIKDMNIHTAHSVLKGVTQALRVNVRYESTKFEFIFTDYGAGSPRLFSTAQTVVRAYETSRSYRDLRLRGSVIKDGELRLLKGEKIISKVPGVWNVSSSQGQLGTLHTTNIRVVWHANSTPNFNVSIPYVMIVKVEGTMSRGTPTMMIRTHKYAGGHTMGFRVEPSERLSSLTLEVQQLQKLYFQRPLFGIEYVVEDADKPVSKTPIKRKEEDFVMEKEDALDIFQQYYDDTAQQRDRPPVYSPSLGLAVESVPEGYTVEAIWEDLIQTAQIAKDLDTKSKV